MTNSTIPQTDPKANYLAHKTEIVQAIQRVLDSGWYILGQETKAFEQEFADYIGVSHALGVGNGTDALEIALRACGIGAGDAVFTVSHTAVATVAAIELTGAMPVLVDIDPVTFTLDPGCLEDALQRYTAAGTPKAVVPVHLYGHPADMPALLEIAQRYGLYVIEDCAQAHGARIDGRHVGSWGDLAAFSFYPTKNLGALGDGGMIVTNQMSLAEKVNLLRQYGWRQRYISDIPGTNSRLDELQAAVLRVKLRHLDTENTQRRNIAGIYDQVLAKSSLVLPTPSPESEHVYHQYVVRSSQRDKLQTLLRECGIGTLIHYPQPVHRQPAYVHLARHSDKLWNSEQAATEVLSLPMYPELTREQATRIANAIIECTTFLT